MRRDEEPWTRHQAGIKRVAQINRWKFRSDAAQIAQCRKPVAHVFGARLNPARALAADDWSACNARFPASIVKWRWVSMNPGLTVRSERSKTSAPGGRPTDRSVFVIRLLSTRISARPVRGRTHCRTPERAYPSQSLLQRLSS